MSTTVFRQIASAGGSADERAERVFLAAVSAFCSLPRPHRDDVQRLEDLAAPLLDRVSVAGRRFAAAALSECSAVPPGLLKRLTEAGVDVAAPLLVRSTALSDADLVSLIARFGAPYAQAIARRAGLHPAIADLVGVMARRSAPPPGIPPEQHPPSAEPDPAVRPSLAGSDHLRSRLRGMMRPAASNRIIGGRTAFLRLRDALGARRLGLFATALADSLAIPYGSASALVRDPGEIALALRALGLKEEEAFLLLGLLHPATLAGVDDGFRFLDHYAKLGEADIAAALGRWRDAPAAGALMTG